MSAHELRAALAAHLGDAQPAHNSLLESFAESVANMHEHDHDREDWYCLNLAAYMGERMAPVLRRLLNAEAEADRLRAELAARPTREAVLREVADEARQHRDAQSAPGIREGWARAERRLRYSAEDAAGRGDEEKDTPAGGESTPDAERSANRLRAFLTPSDTDGSDAG